MKRKLFIISAVIILTILVSIMILTPPVARWYINKHGKELIGRNISLEKIRINYFTFTFRVIGFKLRLVEDYLKSKDFISKLKIFIPNPDAVKNVGSQPVFEVKFSMEE